MFQWNYKKNIICGGSKLTDINYTFQISPYDIEKLLPQVSKALEKRTEFLSRENYKGIWKYTDKFNAMAQGRTRSRVRTRLVSVVCLAVGIFLIVPGLAKPQELLVPLLAGIAAIATAISGLLCSRKHKKNPFDKSARLLLSGKDSISTEKKVSVSFTEHGMMIPTDNDNTELVPYSDFECVVETADILLFVYRELVTVLQKYDLATENVNDFCQFISEKVERYQSII